MNSLRQISLRSARTLQTCRLRNTTSASSSSLPLPTTAPQIVQSAAAPTGAAAAFSTSAATIETSGGSGGGGSARAFHAEDGPVGELFHRHRGAVVGPHLIGQTASIQRTFGPQSNAQAMLTCGGESLAAHASFDPDYQRAQGWIRHHAVGPAVLSPVLIAGLTGALVEAAFPQAVPICHAMNQVRPLIVGVAVTAKIQVESVTESLLHAEESSDGKRRWGYRVDLKTEVSRVRDDRVIAEGTHSIWIPDYLSM